LFVSSFIRNFAFEAENLVKAVPRFC
jgi:hypothetical protein